jgi:hypothetical protein
MSILVGAFGSAAEVMFQLASGINPNNPVTGQDFTTGTYVSLWLPVFGAFVAVPSSQIVEKGFGTYAVRLTALQTALDGTAYVFAYVPGVSQPSRVQSDIVSPGLPARRELPFVIMPLSDPVYDSGGLGLGHSFTLGEVQTRFSTDSGFANVSLGQIAERGYNMYAVVLTGSQRAVQTDDALVAFNSSSPVPFVPFVAEWDMIVSSYGRPTPAPPTPPPPYTPPPSLGPVDQVALGVNRLCQQFKTKVIS